MVSKAHVLSPNRPDFNDIMTLQASGVPGGQEKKAQFVPYTHKTTTGSNIVGIRSQNGCKLWKL